MDDQLRPVDIAYQELHRLLRENESHDVPPAAFMHLVEVVDSLIKAVKIIYRRQSANSGRMELIEDGFNRQLANIV